MPWIPSELPERAAIGGLAFVPLSVLLVEADYAAVMRDTSMLRTWSGEDWPRSATTTWVLSAL